MLLVAFPFLFLWYVHINQLRVEWTVNPQYSYGWFVPFLCLYLAWRNRSDGLTVRRSDGPTVESVGLRSGIFVFSACALALAPTRLIQEANPEWRLISSLLALEVIAITFVFLSFASTLHSPPSTAAPSTVHSPPSTGPPPTVHRPLPTVHRPLPTAYWFAFPLFFFLVAVPWPTIIEGPLIQALTRANAYFTVEGLSLCSIPAIPHGNTIEVGTGIVGLDDACSGIRSFQSSLMISLFLGEFYRLWSSRRLLLVLGGFILGFFCNVVRTSILVWVAAKHGTSAIAQWHDPTGVTILVACFIGLWLLALLLSRSATPVAPEVRRGTIRPLRLVTSAATNRLSLALGIWLILVEGGVQLWYRSHESQLPTAVAWKPELPREATGFRDLPISEKTRQYLRYDEAQNVAWREDGTAWQMIFLRWNPGKIAVHLAKGHTPEVCLAAAGKQVTTLPDLKVFKAGPVDLPFREYVVEQGGLKGHVFYCLWEDRAHKQGFQTTELTYQNRLEPVLAGRRHLGQRSLELIVWGHSDLAEAEAAVARRLPSLIRVAR